MKSIIYISGISGGLLLVLRIVGVMEEFPFNDLLLISAVVLPGLVFLPLRIIDRIMHERKINRIIRESEGKERSKEKVNTEPRKTKGWGMNNSPYRERKGGLTWGGGNIKGATATRGARKSFLR